MMKRRWSSITACFAATLAVASLSALADSSPISVSGAMVDPEMPATYRLPPVALPAEGIAAVANNATPLFAAPTAGQSVLPQPTAEVREVGVASRDEIPAPSSPTEREGLRIATKQTEVISTTLPAGAPPDDDRVDDTATSSVAVSVAAARIVLPPPPALRSEPIQTVAAAVAPTAPPTSDLSLQLLAAVQRGTGLAERGALYAARTEFIQVLRRLAQGKDAALNSDEHSRSLAAGLRALNEAEDFVPDGVQLEAEMNVRTIASSHRTHVLPEEGDVTPLDAVTLYHAFAEEQLAKAAAGERAGSMALYGLGRVHARLAEQSHNDIEQTRAATTMHAAALAACPDNHLAANELGVLACRAGRPQEATELFQQAIDVAPSATAYHNLAMAQHKLGLHGPSAANGQESQRLAALERARGDVSRRAGVRWVAPDELARTSQPNQWTAEAMNRPVADVPAAESSDGKFQIGKLFSRAKGDESDEARELQSYPRVSRPVGHDAGVRRWR
jgi:tetratricopeptide (TPR) repeat protein